MKQIIYKGQTQTYTLMYLNSCDHLGDYNVLAVVSPSLQVPIVVSNLAEILNWTFYSIPGSRVFSFDSQESDNIIYSGCEEETCKWHQEKKLTGKKIN